MSTLRLPIIAALCLCILLTGCHVGSGPKNVARYKPGDDPEMKRARYWGDYKLYAIGNQRNPRAGQDPVATVHLASDERVGFKRDANGYVVAAAADQVFPLERQNYLWQMNADPQQIDKGKVGLGVIGVWVGAVAIIAVSVALATPF
ncbi:MAG: hypothetical protein QOF78_391 [Phycisphaerales bacterium]|jgi:hypothetical protein|nr:hypothetical protein [Phycisphaerales bacterium]